MSPDPSLTAPQLWWLRLPGQPWEMVRILPAQIRPWHVVVERFGAPWLLLCDAVGEWSGPVEPPQ